MALCCEKCWWKMVLGLVPVLWSPECASWKAQLCVSNQLWAVLALQLAFPEAAFSVEKCEKCQ